MGAACSSAQLPRETHPWVARSTFIPWLSRPCPNHVPGHDWGHVIESLRGILPEKALSAARRARSARPVSSPRQGVELIG